ncbi:hypothetical protein BCD_1149 (plasmid) [Borrelia crocidurae DOU]|uniref:Uncharacterized protein n=1 Tax=Borrelia crocidurae DOU TaxID=1293575 RepID=W5SJY1_9SPIR|nr:hypothetical protein BCD_1149 [Borrelia crocidurae DOU]
MIIDSNKINCCFYLGIVKRKRGIERGKRGE